MVMYLPLVDEPTMTLPDLAVSALVDEASLTPKPALVDQRGNGAHHDLDLPRLLRSARSLREGFGLVAYTATGERPSQALREELARIGRDMERTMLESTSGSNAHRGAIWSLGLLVAACAAHVPKDPVKKRSVAAVAALAATLARHPDRFAPRSESHGERASLRFGVPGARGEARAGFPHVISLGLPVLRAARRNGALEAAARIDALLAIMAHLDDTCLLHRGGLRALMTAKSGALAVLAAGGTSTTEGRRRLDQLHAKLMTLWASPGGSGDLLAATLFLDRWERGTVTRRTGDTGVTSWRL